MLYGILKSATNTGLDSELQSVFAAPLTIRSNKPSFFQDTLNLKRPTGSQGVQRWEISANICPENGSANHLLHSARYGHDTEFYVRMPQVVNLPTSAAVTLTSNASAGVDTLDVTAAVGAGEFVNIGADSKVYLVIESTVSTIKITPPLRLARVIGDTVKTGGTVTIKCKYDGDVQLGITYTDGVLSDPGQIKMVESL